MTTTLIEETTGGTLTFEFSDKWQVYKYDEQSPDNFYEKIKHLGLKAVDFIAVSEKSILLIEVKYIKAVNNKSRMCLSPQTAEELLIGITDKLTEVEQKSVNFSLKRPCLADEVAKKTKDTLTGLLAGYRVNDEKLQPFNQSLFVDNRPILLILFLERKGELNQIEQFKPLANSLKKAIEQKIGFLGNINVDVINTLTVPSALKINVLNTTS